MQDKHIQTVDQHAVVASLARTLNEDPTAKPWSHFEAAVARLFGDHILFTVLVYDAQQSLLRRQHSNRADLSPPTGAKRVTDSPYVAHVFKAGRCFLGAVREDLQVFSEYASLWAAGCESVLNIPVRHRGQTIGTINALGAAHQYDGYDADTILMLAKLAVPYLLDALAHIGTQTLDIAALEKV